MDQIDITVRCGNKNYDFKGRLDCLDLLIEDIKTTLAMDTKKNTKEHSADR